jgi:hypothetical protein
MMKVVHAALDFSTRQTDARSIFRAVGDVDRPHALRLQRAPVTPLSKAGGLCRRRPLLPWLCPRAAAPAGGWSQTSANIPSMSKKHFPAAAPVSIGCSVAMRLAPRPRTFRAMSCRSPMLRAKRSIRVTIRTSPACKNSNRVRSCSPLRRFECRLLDREILIGRASDTRRRASLARRQY